MAFSTPPQTAGEQYALSACLCVLATAMVALRMYAVRVRGDRPGADDYCILLALVFTWGTGIVNIVAASAGDEGQHTVLSPQGMPVMTPKYVVFLKAIYANQLVQLLAVGPTKISVLLFYRRIFVGKVFRWITAIMIGLSAGWKIAFFFGNMLECIPIDHAWAHVVGGYPDPACVDAVALYLAQAYIDVIMDFIILVLPIPNVWMLQMPVKRRLAVISIFLVGLLTIAASCAKLVIQMFVGTEIAHEEDISYFLTPIMYWPLIEAALGITAACLPKMRTLWADHNLLSGFVQSMWQGLSSSSLLTWRSKRKSASSSDRDSDVPSHDQADAELGVINPPTSKSRAFGSKSQLESITTRKYGRLLPAEDTIMIEREFGTTVSRSAEGGTSGEK